MTVWASILKVGIKSLLLHKLRSGLTMLGIIFGVSSVIIMLAVGEGAAQAAQDQIRGLGSQNIIIETVEPPKKENPGASTTARIKEFGLLDADVARLESGLPEVAEVVPMFITREQVRIFQRATNAEVIGTTSDYQRVRPIRLLAGRFLSENDLRRESNVCVISESLVRKLFSERDPLRSSLQIDDTFFQVVGIVSREGTKTGEGLSKMTTDGENRVFVPLTAARKRLDFIENRQRIELHRIIVKLTNPEAVLTAEGPITQLLNTFHPEKDWEMTVPLRLLEEAAASQRLFNLVLGSIAAISLLVGGIGIMNIMLATVTERTREIGIRRALGARKTDIVAQFLAETVVLTVVGGLLGLVLGLIGPTILTNLAGLPTEVTAWSVVLAFGISALTGVIFGLYPAYKAAQLDPIEALRQE